MAKEQWEAWWLFTHLVIKQAEVSWWWCGSTLTSTCFLMCCCLGTISRTANPASKQVADPGNPPGWNCCAFPFVVYVLDGVKRWLTWHLLWKWKGSYDKTIFLDQWNVSNNMTHHGTEEKVGWRSKCLFVIQISCLRQRCHEWLQNKHKMPVPWHTRQSNSPCLGCLRRHGGDLLSKWALHPFFLNNQFSCTSEDYVGLSSKRKKGDHPQVTENSVFAITPKYTVLGCWKDGLFGLCQSLTFVPILLPVSKLELLTELVWVSVKCGKCYQCTFHLPPGWEMLDLLPMLQSLQVFNFIDHFDFGTMHRPKRLTVIYKNPPSSGGHWHKSGRLLKSLYFGIEYLVWVFCSICVTR